MRRYDKLLLSVLFLVAASSLFGQKKSVENSKPCTNHPVNKGKYKILSAGLGGVESQFYIEIKPKYRTDENYLTIAKEFKEKYCHEKQLRVIYLTGKKQWLILDPFDLEATPLAIFYTGKNTTEKEGIEVYKIVNGKVETRKLDLTQ